MFSPTNGTTPAGAPARASRRRPRPTSNEHITSQPKAKRQRASIDPQTFVHPDGGLETRPRKSSVASTLVRKESRDSLPQKRELSVRSKKIKGDRYHKGDGSTVLTKNDTYTVSRLPALPDRLQSANAGRQHGSINADRGYALTLNKTHALVWPYAVNTTTPETFTFTLPHPSKHDTDLLPLGSLVSPSASATEPGLVVVMPTSGKVTYWESISSAATLDLIQQQRHGVEYSIQGMYHNETVLQILNAESAGFVLTFSTGRLAYLSVRDGQGRPAIATQYLRSANSQGASIFGSFKSMLSSSWKGDLAAARAGPSPGPGERTVVTAGTKGKLSVWNLHRGGHNHLEAEGEARDLIVEEIKRTDPSLMGLDSETFELHDFTFAPPPAEQARSDALTYREENGTELLVLSSITNQGVAHYALVQIFIRPGTIAVGAVRHITSYSTPVAKNAISKPRLYLPNPGVAAFIVFQRAVVITSMANEPDSPEAQLLADSCMGPQTFEDVVDFRRDTGVEITGSGLEEPHAPTRSEDPRHKRHASKVPAVVLQVKGDGIIRIALVDPTKFTSSKPPQVTAKSKLEQAVFFGNMDNNILSFSGRSEIQFGSEEVGKAALALSHEILTSSTPYLPSIPATIRENMVLRQEALDTLIKHTQKMNVELDRGMKWKLMWAAEKLAGAAAAWEKYDSGLATRPQDIKNDLWDLIVLYIREDMKAMPNPDIGETDRVRHYFVHDVDKFQMVITFANKAIEYKQKSAAGKLTPHQMAHLICEANELIISTLEAAYAFRLAHVEAYGIEDNVAGHKGLVDRNLDSIPEPWTCMELATSSIKNQALACIQFLVQAEKRDAMSELEQLNQIRKDLPKIVDLACLVADEKQLWWLNQKDKKRHEKGLKLEEEILATQKRLLSNIADIGLADAAIDLAQRHEVLPTLAQLLMDKVWEARRTISEFQAAIGQTDADLHELQDAIAGYEAELEEAEARRESVFAEFGYFWAAAQYDYFIKRKHSYDLLLESTRHPVEITRYLREHKEYAKLAWINEIKTDKNFDLAAQALVEQGIVRETDLWSKKVELSIGKLVRLAGKNYSQVGGLIVPDAGASDLKEVERHLEIVAIQEKIFAHVRPATRGAIDDDAERDVALDVFGNPQLEKKMALSTVLNEKMGWLLSRSAMNALDLVDLLTLMGPRKLEAGQRRTETDITGQEFYYALKVLNADGPEDKSQFILAEKTIWRRCLLRDDWKTVNSTAHKGDAEVAEQTRGTALYSTLKLALKNNLFTKPSRLVIISPAQLLSTSTVLDSRYSGLDEGIRGPLLADHQAEDSQLKHLMEKLRLQKWFEGCLSVARKDVERENKEEETEKKEVENMAERLEQVELLIERSLRETAREMLGAKQASPMIRRRREGSRGVQGLLKQGSSLGSSFRVSFQSSIRP